MKKKEWKSKSFITIRIIPLLILLFQSHLKAICPIFPLILKITSKNKVIKHRIKRCDQSRKSKFTIRLMWYKITIPHSNSKTHRSKLILKTKALSPSERIKPKPLIRYTAMRENFWEKSILDSFLKTSRQGSTCRTNSEAWKP